MFGWWICFGIDIWIIWAVSQVVISYEKRFDCAMCILVNIEINLIGGTMKKSARHVCCRGRWHRLALNARNNISSHVGCIRMKWMFHQLSLFRWITSLPFTLPHHHFFCSTSDSVQHRWLDNTQRPNRIHPQRLISSHALYTPFLSKQKPHRKSKQTNEFQINRKIWTMGAHRLWFAKLWQRFELNTLSIDWINATKPMAHKHRLHT